MNTFMADLGARMVDNGWPVIPIMPGAKKPGRFAGGEWADYPGWTRHCDRPTKPLEVDIWRRWPGCAVGVPCGAVVGIDIDILDAKVAHEMQALAFSMLGETPCLRIGLAPKRMLVYRAAAPFAGIKRHPIEVLARGQQFVAWAIHPDTGRPYDWPNETPLDMAVEDLPAVTAEQCAAFAEAAWKSLPPELQQHSIMVSAPVSGWKGPADPKGTRDAILSALACIPNEDLPWDDWFRIGMALKGALGDGGRDIWLDWSKSSSKSGKSGKPNTAEKLWKQARPHSLGAGTIYWLAEQKGWLPEPHLVLNGNAAERAGEPHPAAALLSAPGMSVIAPPRPAYRVPAELLEVGGLLKLFVDHAVATAIRPQPFLALAAALCMLGALAGRRYRTPSDLRSNLYVIGIADSSAGKERARTVVKQTVFGAGLGRYLGGEKLASSAGLISSLQIHPSRLFLIDEFGEDFLAKIFSPKAPVHLKSVWDELTMLYTSAPHTYIGAEYADQKARPRVTIEQPCACIYGTTVPAPLWSALQHGALSNGSLARFLVFKTDCNYPQRNRRPSHADVPQALIDGAKLVARGVPSHNHGGDLADAMQASAAIKPYTVPFDAPALAEMDAADDAQDEWLQAYEGEWQTSVFGRYSENVAKIALISAISRDPANPAVGRRDVQWAAKLVDHCIQTLLQEAERFVAENPIEAKHKKVLDLIRSAGTLTKSEITNRTKFIDERERKGILDALVEGGSIIRVREATGGRPVERFTAVSHFEERKGRRGSSEAFSA